MGWLTWSRLLAKFLRLKVTIDGCFDNYGFYWSKNETGTIFFKKKCKFWRYAVHKVFKLESICADLFWKLYYFRLFISEMIPIPITLLMLKQH